MVSASRIEFAGLALVEAVERVYFWIFVHILCTIRLHSLINHLTFVSISNNFGTVIKVKKVIHILCTTFER